MNIGDRVRLLHGKEEGIIRKISSSGRIEVEIEDGFVIPAMKSEAVVISEVEKSYFGESKVQEDFSEIPQ
ncbi:MAG TPA: DNA mismatch repair protein MutS, partial [Algoriphagus sp.]|nr:DNA mismatch repair protein MutS [Algoriphagus sp.]